MSTTTPHSVSEPTAHAGVRLPSRMHDVPITGISFARLVRLELRKATDTRAGRWLLVAITALVLGALAAVMFTGAPGTDKDFGNFYSFAFLPLNVLLPIVGILMVTAEWSQRTGLATFGLEPNRARVGFAKLVAGLVLGAATIAVACVAAVGATALTQVIRGSDPSWSLGWETGLGNVLAQFVTVSMGIAFGLILQNTPAAIVSYLVLPQLWTVLNGISWLQSAGEWLDTNRTLEPLIEGEIHGEQWSQLVVSIVVWVLLPFVAGLIRLRRSEVK
ncbi:ABC transporter permease [Dermacoccaceae bacterium W4C1]